MYSLTNLTLYLVVVFLLTVIVAIIALSRKFYKVLQSYEYNCENDSAFITITNGDYEWIININEVSRITTYDVPITNPKCYKISILYNNGNSDTISFNDLELRTASFVDLCQKLED